MRSRCAPWWGPPLLVCLAWSHVAGQKPRVGVTFQVVAEVYGDRYSLATIQLLNDSSAAVLARVLSQRFGFLDFSSDTNATAFKLTGSLRESARRPNRFDEVRLFLELRGTERAHFLNWISVRPRESMDPVPEDPVLFLAAFGQLLEDSITDAAATRLVDSVLTEIPIADTAATVWRPAADRPPDMWLLPYKRAELCIGFESNLRIHYSVRRTAGTQKMKLTAEPTMDFSPPSSAPPRFQRFVGSIGATPAPQDTSANRIRADTVEVTAVYVSKYLFDEDSCRLPVGPIP